MSDVILFGLFEHYKGGLYFVRGVATHSETEEALVVYQQMDGEKRMFVRPLAMFLEEVTVDGVQVPRFRKLPMLVEDTPMNMVLTKVSDVRGN